VKAEEAKASYKNGVLRVELPKAEASKRRVITIPVE
jgi:HSP20 family molecular chaperone IbpA